MAATVAVWKLFVKVYGARDGGEKWSPCIPLWRNPKLPELSLIPDFDFWPQKGFKYLTSYIMKMYYGLLRISGQPWGFPVLLYNVAFN